MKNNQVPNRLMLTMIMLFHIKLLKTNVLPTPSPNNER